MKKGTKKALIALAVVAVLGSVGWYLSQTFVRWKLMEYYLMPTFIDGVNVSEDYPYTDVEVPEEFEEYSMNGIVFKAPAGLSVKGPLEDSEGYEYSWYLTDNEDKSKRELSILISGWTTYFNKDSLINKHPGFHDLLTVRGMKKLGYEEPQNSFDLIYAVNTFDPKECNKFSPSEVIATSKLMLIKTVLVPTKVSINGISGPFKDFDDDDRKYYYFDNGTAKSFVDEGATSEGGSQLIIELYSMKDPDNNLDIAIACSDPEVGKQILNSINIAEE